MSKGEVCPPGVYWTSNYCYIAMSLWGSERKCTISVQNQTALRASCLPRNAFNSRKSCKISYTFVALLISRMSFTWPRASFYVEGRNSVDGWKWGPPCSIVFKGSDPKFGLTGVDPWSEHFTHSELNCQTPVMSWVQLLVCKALHDCQT